MEFPNLRLEFSLSETYYISALGSDDVRQGPFTRDELLVCIRGPYYKQLAQAEKLASVQAFEALRVRALQNARVNRSTYIRRADSSKWTRIDLDDSFKPFKQTLKKVRKENHFDLMLAVGGVIGVLSLLFGGTYFMFNFIAEKTAGDPLAALHRGVKTVNTMPLINAIRRNNVEAVRAILTRNPQLANAEGSTEPHFERPLAEAMLLRRSECVELLLQHGAAVKSPADTVPLLFSAIATDP